MLRQVGSRPTIPNVTNRTKSILTPLNPTAYRRDGADWAATHPLCSSYLPQQELLSDSEQSNRVAFGFPIEFVFPDDDKR